MPDQVAQRVQAEPLKDFCVQAFQKVGVAEQDARITADILVAADLRGVFSHGVAHLRRYVGGLRAGSIIACPQEKMLAETPATAAMDAGAGLGQPVSYRAMQRAIQKALEVGVGFVTVRNSNHYGIAGYYAMMALPHNCIGLSMTNASPKVVPTFGRHAALGTNPIAMAAPAGGERPFVLDMATSTVSVGKIEIADQLDRPIPVGWAVDPQGRAAEDAHRTLDELKRNVGGGLLPLGGAGEGLSGYKGYGLALGVEILTALLSGAAHATHTYPKTPGGRALPANIGHLFGAWRVDGFRPVDEFKAAMDDLQQMLRNAAKEDGHDRIYIHGEKEYEAAERHGRDGIPLNHTVAADLYALGQELGVEYPL
jgi:L-2-hydroxycarboxylate dehydrogenase (NAD+)